jgi:predicted methyltransferase
MALRCSHVQVGIVVLLAAGCGAPPAPTAGGAQALTTPAPRPSSSAEHIIVTATPELRALLAAPDRSDADRALDSGRRPAELLTFAGVRPGMRVAEIGAWQGYTAELLARAVAPDGTVYAEDPPTFDKWTHAAWEERAKRPAFARIVRVARPFDDPLPQDTPPLDVVFSILFYHDTVWLGVDRAKMNAAIFHALKPGGSLVVVDHSARPGEGARVAKSLHRIEESLVLDELSRAGFVFAADSNFLRHPEDPRDWSASDEAPPEKRGTSDRFVLRLRKP